MKQRHLLSFFVSLCLCGFLTPATLAADKIVVSSAILTTLDAVDVPAPEAGIVQALTIREGERVKKGEALGSIDAREQQLMAEVVKQDLSAAQEEAQSDVRVRLAGKEHEVAKVELQRAESVNKDFPGTVSAKEVDRLKLAVDKTALEIEYAHFERSLLLQKIRRTEADLRLAQHRVDRLKILTPIPGIIASMEKETGEWADKGELVARVVRVDRLKVEGYVSLQDAVAGLVGRSVDVATVLPNNETIRSRGKIVFVSPEAEPVNAQVRFWAEVENGEMKLRPGLTASLTILAPEPGQPTASTR